MTTVMTERREGREGWGEREVKGAGGGGGGGTRERSGVGGGRGGGEKGGVKGGKWDGRITHYRGRSSGQVRPPPLVGCLCLRARAWAWPAVLRVAHGGWKVRDQSLPHAPALREPAPSARGTRSTAPSSPPHLYPPALTATTRVVASISAQNKTEDSGLWTRNHTQRDKWYAVRLCESRFLISNRI